MSRVKILWIGLLLLAGVAVSAQQKADPKQVFKFLTTGFSVMERDAKGNWGKWSDLRPTSIVVVLDTKKDRIIVYSQEIQVYAILNYEEAIDNESDLIYPFTCTDDDGQRFTISFITRKKQDNRKQLYINQQNVIVMYNIVNYPDKNIEVK